MKELTRAEEEIMQVLWRLESAFVREIIAEFADPKPAYNTVSTIVRILEQKGFVGHKQMGKSHRYHPLMSKQAYSKQLMKGVVGRFFSGSYQQMVSFFANENDMSLSELEEVLNELKDQENE
ncbi:MAG: BlaI/MecI/CopY family transcriptional regulator [Cyclobacteriaceae bacterium]|nr:BlaI/MecI/CopY family transcriptional regulator [Cyclobacteriaceae bacterium]